MSDPKIEHPYYPIIYVRGYAGNESVVEDTTSTAYYGFSDGSAKGRQRWTGDIETMIFESPLVRLMKDHGYLDNYMGGSEIPRDKPIDPKSVIVYRYYDQVSHDLGNGKRLEIIDYARGLSELVARVRDQVCQGSPEALRAFRVYLVAHSMGGLVCRSFLQHPHADPSRTRRLVDKVFTYATPHNGIDLRFIDNVPGIFTRNNADNFNRKKMAQYLALPDGSDRVDSLNGAFDTRRFFSLVGTNHRDYAVAGGIARKVVGPLSDGLVRIANATVRKTPRAFVHRAHSGQYGIVNSEEGYQNLTRFLFGDLRVDGVLSINELSLPPRVRRAMDDGKSIRASYHFETIVRPRGARFDLTNRTVDHGSAVFRRFDELFARDGTPLTDARSPHLFSTFLSIGQRTRDSGPLVFSVELRIRVPDYEIDRRFFFDDHIEGSYLWRDTIHIAAVPPGGDSSRWTVRYGLDSRLPGRPGRTEADLVTPDGADPYFAIPIVSNRAPGIDAVLQLRATPWNRPPA